MKNTALKIRLSDADGKIYHWTIRRVPRVYLCSPEGPLSRSRVSSGWEYESHDGTVRFQEGNFLAVVPRFKLTAENYGLTLCSELS
jgi:hypothetical protein